MHCRLFKHVDSSLLHRDTYKTMIDLFNNYNSQTGIRESESNNERMEIAAFLDSIFNTKLWNVLYDTLHDKRNYNFEF